MNRPIARLLATGRDLALASHTAALLAGLLWTHAARIPLAASLLVWTAGLYLALRVSLDAGLFLDLETDADGEALDAWLAQAGLSGPRAARPLAQRARGAVRWWRFQIAALAAQLLLVALALLWPPR